MMALGKAIAWGFGLVIGYLLACFAVVGLVVLLAVVL